MSQLVFFFFVGAILLKFSFTSLLEYVELFLNHIFFQFIWNVLAFVDLGEYVSFQFIEFATKISRLLLCTFSKIDSITNIHLVSN